jgi:integrase
LVQSAGTKGIPEGLENPTLPENLKRTPSGYLFRKVIPKPLRGIIGKSEFKIPCGKVYAEALVRYHIEVVKAHQVIDAARAKLSEQMDGLSVSRGRFLFPETYLKPITTVTPELVEELRGFWLAGLEHDLAERAQGLDDEEYDEFGENIAEMQVAFGRAMARGQLEVILPSLHQTLHLRGYVLALRPEEERRLAYEFLAAVMEGYEVLSLRHKGIRAEKPTITAVLPEHNPTCSGAKAKADDGKTVGDVIEDFLTNYAKKRTGKSMLKKHQVALPLLGEMVGMTLPITKLRQRHINRYFEEIQRLPSRWPDVCRQNKITVLQLLQDESLLGTKGMAPKTFIDGYRASISSFLRATKLAFQDEGFPTTLTTEGIEYTGTREEGENAQRPMYMHELKRLFEGPEMHEIAQDASRAHLYWLPHIGVFTGARINEVCQINPQVDIHQDEPSGIWYMRVTEKTEADEDVTKSTKNEVSERNIPFHPVLIKLGITDYLSALREAGATLLFPGFPPKNGRASPNAEKWFRKFIVQLGLRDETPGARLVGYHAFRSTILNQGQELNIDLTSITGHAGGLIVDSVVDSQGAHKTADKIIRQYQRERSVQGKMSSLSRLDYSLQFVKPAKPSVESIAAQKVFEA